MVKKKVKNEVKAVVQAVKGLQNNATHLVPSPKKKKKQKRKRSVKKMVKKQLAKLGPLGSVSVGDCMNGYLHSLIDPFNVRGVRIPDNNTQPSVTVTTWDYVQFTVGTAGTFMVQATLAQPMFGSSQSIFSRANDLGPDTNIAWSSNSSIAADLLLTPNTAAYGASQSLFDLYANMRVVSAGLRLEYLGATLDHSGLLIANSSSYQQQYDKFILAGDKYVFNDMLTWPRTMKVPVNQFRSVQTMYQPMDASFQQYGNGVQMATEEPEAGSPETYYWDVTSGIQAMPPNL
jgi:hypothetical protein